MNRFHRVFIMVLSTSLLTGCAGSLPHWQKPPEADARAEAMLRAGDYEGAAQRYAYLARSTSEPDHYWLQAADAVLHGGDSQAAQQWIDFIQPRELDAIDQNQYWLITSRLDLNAGRAREAMSKLNMLVGLPLEGKQETHYHALRASAYNQMGDMLSSAKELVLLGKRTTQTEAIRKNNEAIYDTLSRLSRQTLTSRPPPPPDELGGWMTLTAILKTTSRKELADAVSKWASLYPGHPAVSSGFLEKTLSESGVSLPPLSRKIPSPSKQGTPLSNATMPIPSPYVQTAPTLSVAPTPHSSFIGVLLPLSGSYGAASKAIQTGMMAAYDADPNPNKLRLEFTDSYSGDVYQSYQHLVEEGAKIVVGPLVKEEVATLAKRVLSTPVLALNQVPDIQNTHMFQLGLRPEHEVEQTASSAWFDGKQQALVLAPTNPFGQRIAQHFTQYWRSIGGTTIAVKTYPYHGKGFSQVVQSAMDTLSSPSTADPSFALSAIPTSSSPFIFLIADTQDARALVPAIMGASSHTVPIYSFSHLYNAKAMPEENHYLNGVVFCDVPWLMNPHEGNVLSAQALDIHVQETPPDYVKLIALGLDAYRLLPVLDRFKTEPNYRFSGATGTLSLQTGNSLQRQLECAQFQNGTLQPRGNAPLLHTDSPASSISPAFPHNGE